MSQDPHYDIWYEDECHFQQHGSRCTTWFPPEEKDPVVLQTPTRKSKSVFGAVKTGNGRFIYQFSDVFNAVTFKEFIQEVVLHRQDEKVLLLILDNSRYHHAKMLHPWLEEHKNEIQLLFLPPYSPDLNSIERVWKLTRKLCTHNRYFPSLEDLFTAISDKFEEWTKPNEQLRKLCVIN